MDNTLKSILFGILTFLLLHIGVFAYFTKEYTIKVKVLKTDKNVFKSWVEYVVVTDKGMYHVPEEVYYLIKVDSSYTFNVIEVPLTDIKIKSLQP